MVGFGDGSGISWTICKQSAPRSRQITAPTPHQSIFTGRMLFLTPDQQCQSTEGRIRILISIFSDQLDNACLYLFGEVVGMFELDVSDHAQSVGIRVYSGKQRPRQVLPLLSHLHTTTTPLYHVSNWLTVCLSVCLSVCYISDHAQCVGVRVYSGKQRPRQVLPLLSHLHTTTPSLHHVSNWLTVCLSVCLSVCYISDHAQCVGVRVYSGKQRPRQVLPLLSHLHTTTTSLHHVSNWLYNTLFQNRNKTCNFRS